ncbi:MAG: condensation domain-containing protein, partial [Pseudonocardiaceae bacterium]
MEVRGGEEDGDKQLVGYVVREEGERGQSWSGLRSYVGGKLPGYMVPGVYVELEELPLTENGKLDRKALRALGKGVEGVGGGGEGEYVAPRTAEEEIVCGIWEEVLKRERVGVEENFFEIGGHSLLATQVVSRIRQVFRVELALRVMFEHPTVRGLAEQVQAERRAGGSRGQRRPRLERREGRGTRMPLSYAQQRLWFLEQLEPGSGLYNVPFALGLKGELKREALQRSVQEMVRRHEVLRTRFVAENGEAVQEVADELILSLPVIDLSALEEEVREFELERLVRREASKGFDLQQGPLLRMNLLRFDAAEHVLLATMHHIVSDGWSVGILVRELGLLYEAYGKGEESPLPELGIQYGDFAVWQREWLQGEVLEEEVGYWRKQLAGLERLELPCDYARQEEGRHRGGAVEFELGEEQTWKLKELSRREGVTLFMVLLGSLQVLLGRYAGQKDIAVGSAIANRNRLETEGLIGFFVNTLVLRTRLEWEAGFKEVLREVRRVVLEGYEHQDVPFEKLVEELAPERELGRNPLFDVMMVLQNAGGEALELAGLRMTAVKQTTEVAKFDLNLGLEERKRGGLRGALNYARELFARETVEQMVRHWKAVLEGVVANPEGRIGALPLLSAEERRQQLVEWNRTERDFPRACVHELFEEQARRRGEAIAVVYEGEQVSYGELNRRANQLGRYLRERGVGPEVAVGLCVERSVEMVVGILGILKAGGGYVPLDPEYPGERLSYMVEDAGV